MAADTVSVSRDAVGPMGSTGGYSRVKITSIGTTEERITARIASGAVHETRHTRNGILVGGSLLRNGLPVFVKQNGNQSKVATFSPLREPLMERDSSSTYWVTRTLDPMSGLVTQRVGPNTGETLAYYTGQDVRAGRLWKRTPLTAGQGATAYSYNAAGQLTAQWGSGTYPVAYAYDEWMRQTRLTIFRSGAGQSSDPGIDPASTASTWTPVTTTGTAASTVWAYPPWLDLVISKTYASGSPAAVTYEYRPNGQLKTRTGQRGRVTTYTYHGTGQLNQINYGNAGTPDVTFGWDTAGRNSSRTDGIGSWTLSYAADGRLLKETTGTTGRSNAWTLDAQGKKTGLKSQFSSSAVNPDVNYYYDSYGRLSSGWSNEFNVTCGYPSGSLRALNRQYAVNVNNGNYDLVMSKSSALFTQGEVSGLTYNAYGSRETYYDSNGEPYEVQPAYALLSLGYTRSYGQVSTVTDSLDGGKWNYQYDSRSQISKGYKQFTASPAQVMAGTQTQYAYDLIGNRTQWREGGSSTLDSGLRDHYYSSNPTTPPASAPAAAGDSADALNQYRSIRRPQAFDITGTRPTGSTAVSITVPPSTAVVPDYQQSSSGLYFRKEISHNAATNGKYSPVTVSITGSPTDSWQQYAPQAAETLGYDADGNLTGDGRWSYEWDEENRLTKMETPAQTGTNPVPGTRLVFTYDGLSRRSKKEVYTTQSGVWLLTLREHYVYDGWNLVLTARENNAPTPVVKRHATYVWGPDLASLPYGRSNWQRAGGVDGLLMVLDGVNSTLAYQNVDYNGATAGLGTPPADPSDNNYFPVTDHLGNIKALFKAEYGGAVTPAAILDCDAFGRELRSTGRAADIVPFHFSTKFTDPESGLSYYGYRFYDPVNGRWINRDPIGIDGGFNVNAAFENNSINHFDYLGLSIEYTDPNSTASEKCRKAIEEIKKTNCNCAQAIREAEIEIPGGGKQTIVCSEGPLVKSNGEFAKNGSGYTADQGPYDRTQAKGSNKGPSLNNYIRMDVSEEAYNAATGKMEPIVEDGVTFPLDVKLCHEFAHLIRKMKGTEDPVHKNEELNASKWENEYREATSRPIRKTYGGSPVPGAKSAEQRQSRSFMGW